MSEVELLQHIDPSHLDYQEWVGVGMALKDAGASAGDWDSWSQQDSGRYVAGECFKKWDTFKGCANPVTGGSLVQLAKDQGWTPGPRFEHSEIEWDGEIGGKNSDLVVVNKGWLEGQEVPEPENWEPHQQLIKYLTTLFEGSENVGYVTEVWEKEDKSFPKKGSWDRTAGQLIEALNECKGDMGSVIGDCKPDVGAWIRFNPLDGNGVKNDNVTEYRYALVESDDMPIDEQNAIIRELELPVACLVHSAKKSLHAIVRINADTYEEYRTRVDYLYDVCKKNGLTVDTQNRNPSRLSRMPGVTRNGKKQFLVDTNIGKPTWEEWFEWIQDINDDLPEPESLTSVWDDLPELSPPLIHGVLRQGHKMLLAGPSKAGKSYTLIELCIAIAEGKTWLQWECVKGKILYVNLELDRASCLHRFKDVYQAMGVEPDNLDNIDIWNLRGKSVPMDKLTPKLIRRAAKKNYIAIVIDPIYKVITGDENSADQMAHFCNQFDRVCCDLGAAVIYCHHHSKGTQGGKKSMDRASGSGVFARDPDSLLDLIELDVTDALKKQQENSAVCEVCADWLHRLAPAAIQYMSQDDQLVESKMLGAVERALGADQYQNMLPDIYKARQSVQHKSAWRVEGTLREFPKFEPVNVWFEYPIHKVDNTGVLKDAEMDDEGPAWKKNLGPKKTKAERETEKKEALETAYNACSIDEIITVAALTEYLGLSDKTVRRRLKDHGDFIVESGNIYKKEARDKK